MLSNTHVISDRPDNPKNPLANLSVRPTPYNLRYYPLGKYDKTDSIPIDGTFNGKNTIVLNFGENVDGKSVFTDMSVAGTTEGIEKFLRKLAEHQDDLPADYIEVQAIINEMSQKALPLTLYTARSYPKSIRNNPNSPAGIYDNATTRYKVYTLPLNNIDFSGKKPEFVIYGLNLGDRYTGATPALKGFSGSIFYAHTPETNNTKSKTIIGLGFGWLNRVLNEILSSGDWSERVKKLEKYKLVIEKSNQPSNLPKIALPINKVPK